MKATGGRERCAARGTVLAAGCVLWRPAAGSAGSGSRPQDPNGSADRSADGEGIELALVHRPKWQDWSHPKGKLKPGEDSRQAAVREVREETGMCCTLGAELPTVRYQAEGRTKEVRYWAARATEGAFTPSREVDELRWLPPSRARTLLTREHDRALLDAFLTVWADAGGE